ncbi:hypothetical protein DBR37_02175 [Herminiimonas sp. KBW02]|uniref:hypothetical protein n=1 Tax=Herminiimonas sp. KBW02 TaxID=2153363 RepID=UPI000F5A62F5|nr:hypothetical protein [Herminiimonas sp. KBW02]RQO37028.1 hypothetical protein DBR37_02175 [Herminiimonas sp. KBW02]
MSALETIGSFVGSLATPVSTYISEKIAERCGRGKSGDNHIVVEFIVLAIVWIPILLLTLIAIAFLLFALGWLFSSF